jgi:prepilin-type N-terminal cleavage/methylation domain-containing protein
MGIVKTKRGFTLIELLVVIAIIALLLSILMPALRRVKEAGKRIQCLNNTKTLALSMLMYVQDYESKFPRAWTNTGGWILEVAGHRTNPGAADKELQLDAIRGGLLFPYVGNTEVYRCPVAKNTEFRTYSIPHSMNGFASDGGTIVTKITQLRNTSGRMLFLDDYVLDWDACWMVNFSSQKWWNTTPIRHGSGGNVFSFADGHADFQIWKDKRTIEWAEACNEAGTAGGGNGVENGNEDIIWAQRAVWGTIGYTPQ